MSEGIKFRLIVVVKYCKENTAKKNVRGIKINLNSKPFFIFAGELQKS